MLLEIFHYSFMIRAFAAGIIVALLAPLIGSFLVSKKYSLIADSLAHVSLAGVALGLLLGIHPLLSATAVAIVVAIVVERLRTSQGVSGEIALSMFLSGGLAVAILLISFAKGFNTDLFSYLFGSITTVKNSDILIISSLGAVVAVCMKIFYKELVSISFDEESALVNGVPVAQLNLLLMILTACVVSVAMRVIGVLLIGALMVIPVVTAMQLKKSFVQTVLYSLCFSVASVIVGLIVSFYADLSPGGTIVVICLGFFFLTAALQKK